MLATPLYTGPLGSCRQHPPVPWVLLLGEEVVTCQLLHILRQVRGLEGRDEDHVWLMGLSCACLKSRG